MFAITLAPRSIAAPIGNMALISSPPELSTEGNSLYHVVDEYLSNILIFYGHVGSATSSSRIHVTILTSAGWQDYPRITLSPTSPLYAAVSHLPREKQGDEVSRGIAVGVLKYFAELSEPVKNALVKRAAQLKGSSNLPKMFDEMHAAEIANRVEKVDNTSEVIKDIQAAYAERRVSSVDLDFQLPSSCFQSVKDGQGTRLSIESSEDVDRFGIYSELIEQLGEPVFIPTSKMRRAPSKPSSLSRGAKFAPEQKEALRLSMCEIVDTEERYVAKIYDLVHSVIEECRQKAKTRGPSSTSPDEEALRKLFPPCLDEILEVNLGFLSAIRSSLEATETEAFDDISKGTAHTTVPKRHDPLGAMAFGKIMQEWFPKFSDPYRQYMHLQPGFSSTLTGFMRDPNSTFTKRVQETGEQTLRSFLMEPIQRLPRYSLLIDAMTATMPASHPAVKPLLKARDIVTEICAMDNPETDGKLQAHQRLHDQVAGWPSTPVSQGRLITATDALSLRPPYRLDKQSITSRSQMFLLFPDTLVLLDKTFDCNISSRGFLANLDKPTNFSLSQSSQSGPPRQQLQYVWSMPLQKLRFCHSTDGSVVHLALLDSDISSDSVSGAYYLKGADEGRAVRFCEDVTKARVESRFSEEERSGNKWSLFGLQSSPTSVQLFAAVCEEEAELIPARTGEPAVRVVFGKSKADRQQLLRASSSLAVASISRHSEKYKLDIEHKFGSGSIDSVVLDDLLAVLSRRVSNILVKAYSVDNAHFIGSLHATNGRLLAAVVPKTAYSTKTHRGFRPASPTKFLASLWGGGPHHATRPSADKVPTLGDFPSLKPQITSALPQTPSPALERSDSRVKMVGSETEQPKDQAWHMLEQTFTAYVLSLRSRAGNIIGRSLRSRDTADQVAVNDLYNVLLEDPSKIQAAAEVSNDVLFAAFENFVWNAWKAEIGPILTAESLKFVQKKYDNLFPSNFEKFFKDFLNNLGPQNKRAFTATMKLLADLLDACGNDGDRGALTVAFAELLSARNDSMAYIQLLDRLVDDYERLFDDSTAIGFPGEEYSSQPNDGSVGGSNYASKTGSVGSQTSSFRKRFGFGLGRSDSKNEQEGKVSSILRSLSKKAGESSSQPSSLSKGSLVRSRSTDSDNRVASFLRPVSRDFPDTGSINNEQAFASRPNSSHSSVHILQTIGERPSPKKKRRSSLSDLTPMKGLSNGLAPLEFTPIQLRQPLGLISPSPSSRPKSSIASESKTPTRLGNTRMGSPTRLGTPVRSTSPNRAGSPTRNVALRKENVALTGTSKATSSASSSLPRPSSTSPTKGYLSERAVNRKPDEAAGTSTNPKKRSDPHTSIPAPRSGTLRERPLSAGIKSEHVSKRTSVDQSSPQKSQTQKLRMQSPQKVTMLNSVIHPQSPSTNAIFLHHSSSANASTKKNKLSTKPPPL